MPAFHVGTHEKGGGRALYRVDYAPAGGWTIGEAFEGAANASFGVRSPRFGLDYLVEESEAGRIGVYRRNSGEWTRQAEVASGGACPCYVAIDAAETCLAVANYQSGSIALFALDPQSGLPCDPPAIYRHAGRGQNKERQEGPHAHCVIFGGNDRTLFHVDLGTDQILAHSFLTGPARITDTRVAYQAPAGSGPRHLLFHPARPLALLISELASTLTLFDIEAGCLSRRSVRSTLPPACSNENIAGHVGLNRRGDRVYATNRGHDSIAVFTLEGDRLELVQTVPSGGRSPRFFALFEDEALLILANEEGGTLTAFKIGSDGNLSRLPGDCSLPGPVFLFPA